MNVFIVARQCNLDESSSILGVYRTQEEAIAFAKSQEGEWHGGFTTSHFNRAIVYTQFNASENIQIERHELR